MSWMKRISHEDQTRENRVREDRVLDVTRERHTRERKMPRALVAGVFATCALMALPVLAQVVGNRTIYLWDGTGATERSVRLGAWGNGDFEVEKNVEGRAQNVLEVRTRNFYEGVRFQFAQPLSLENYRQSGLLRFRLRSERLSTQLNMPGGSALPGVPGSVSGGTPNPYGAPAYNPYASPGGINPTGNPYASPGGFPDSPDGPRDRSRSGASGATPTPTPPSINTIQVVMRMERGALFGQFAFDEKSARPDLRGWQTFVLPLSQMRATPDASGGLRTVVISGNREGTFDLAQLALVPNASSSSVSIRRANDPVGTQQTTIEVQPGPLNLVADVESGGNDVVVEWNFDADNTGALLAPPLDVLPRTAPTPGAPGSPFGGSPYPGLLYGNPQPGSPPAYGGSRPGSSSGGSPFGSPSGSNASSIQIRGERLDARGHTAQVQLPNEEQDYRVEVTVKDRTSLRETGKASVIVKVRSVE